MRSGVSGKDGERRNMTIQQLYYAITISEKGSLNKASEVLYVSQPSLTSAVRELERELGITVFNRSGRGVTLTNDGEEFLRHAREVVWQYERLLEKYGQNGSYKKKFGVSTQHYSFAVKGFVEMVEHFGTEEFEFAIRETRTREVIDDVASGRSEIGILYLSDFNRKAIGKILGTNGLEFHKLTECDVYVYLWKGHPLASKGSVRPEELNEYPCLSFEQGAGGSLYYAEEILSENDHPRSIKATDRATMLNLMVGLKGYTYCSGIICEELNGTDFIAVRLDDDGEGSGYAMEIGYIVKKNMILSHMAEIYIEEINRCLNDAESESREKRKAEKGGT